MTHKLPPDANERLSNILVTARMSKNGSRHEIAALLGMSEKYFAEIERSPILAPVCDLAAVVSHYGPRTLQTFHVALAALHCDETDLSETPP